MVTLFPTEQKDREQEDDNEEEKYVHLDWRISKRNRTSKK
jgi:hypothetical protein